MGLIMSKRATKTIESDFADRALLGAETEIQNLAKTAANLLIVKEALEREGQTDAIVELQKRLKPTLDVIWLAIDGPAKIRRRLNENFREATSYGTTYLTNSKVA